MDFSCEINLSQHCASGLDKIEFLQNHENLDIYQKAFDIIEHYFGSEEEDNRIAPKIDESTQQYQFNAGEEAPSGGFQFWRTNRGGEQVAPVRSRFSDLLQRRLCIVRPPVER